MRQSLKSVWMALLLSSVLGLLTHGANAQSTSKTNVTLPELIEQGRQALAADDNAVALELLKEAMARPEFERAPSDLHYFTLMLASYAASGSGDFLTAHEYLQVVTTFPSANGEDWVHRAGTAQALEKWDDAALSLTAAAKKWPSALAPSDYNTRLVMDVARELGKRPVLHAQRRELLETLFEAGFKLTHGAEPSYLWLLLVADALERKDMNRARTVARRITNPETLVSMRIDKRFDALTSKESKTFDVRAAAERHARRMKDVTKGRPKELGAVVQYARALYTLGEFQQMLELTDQVLIRLEKAPRDAPPYDDLDRQLNWVHNRKATALRALGRWDEAARVLADWKRSGHDGNDKVSQAINLGFYYNELGRPEEALAAVEGLDWARGMSPYGRTQCQFVRFQAFMQLGETSQADEVVTWMRQHQSDARQTAQDTLLESGDVDGAAALLISRLRDVEERPSVLQEIQVYASTPRTERQKQLDAGREALLSRPDVVAVIAEYGRRERFSIYSMEH